MNNPRKSTHSITKGEIMRDKKKSKTTGKSQNANTKNCK